MARDDGTVAHRGEVREPDELEQRPHLSPLGPAGEIDGLGQFARGMSAAGGGRRLAGLIAAALLLVGLAVPMIVTLLTWLRG